MITKEIVTIDEYCDIVKKEIEMDIDYNEIPILGKLSKEYKRGGFVCSNEDCNIKHCPIYEKQSVIKKDL